MGAAAGGKSTKAKDLSKTEAKNILRGKKIKPLPETAEKTSSVNGLFFEKRSQPATAGHFFRDLPGREDGDFLSKGAADALKPQTTKINVGATGGAMGGQGFRADGIAGDSARGEGQASPSGGLYGTGDGEESEKSEDTKGREEDAERLRALLASAAGGTERKAEMDKTSSRSPSDWDADTGLPTGFHRPAAEPPEGNEGLEAGAERFLTSDPKEPSYGATTGVRHGLTETGGLKTKATSSPQVGKHASALPSRFLGTKFGTSKVAAYRMSSAEDYAGDVGGKYRESMGKLWSGAKRKADETVKGIASDPAKAGIATGIAGLLGYRLLRGGGRKAMQLVRGKPKQPTSLIGQAAGHLSRLFGGK